MSDDQLGDAVRRQMERSSASMRVNRRGWTDKQWVEDARRLMDEPDGAVTSLLNGHVTAMLRMLDQGGNDMSRPEPMHNWCVPITKNPDGTNGRWKCMDCGTENDSLEGLYEKACPIPSPSAGSDERLIQVIEGDGT